MSRIHETSRGGVGASEVSANCHHADRVCVKGPRGEVTTLTICMLETQEKLFTGCLHVTFPSEGGKISETLPGLRLWAWTVFLRVRHLDHIFPFTPRHVTSSAECLIKISIMIIAH